MEQTNGSGVLPAAEPPIPETTTEADSNQKVNLNTASAEELAEVPGVGPAMATRIMAARPFQQVEELRQVSGIGPAVLERMQAHVTLDQADPEMVEADEAVVEVEDEPEADTGTAELEEVAEETPEQESEVVAEEESVQELAEDEEISFQEEDEEASPEDFEPAGVLPPIAEVAEEREVAESVAPEPRPGVSRAQVFWLAMGSSFLAFVLAIALTLGVLASLNQGRLQFASPGQINDLNRQITGLMDQAGTLQQDVAGLRQRMDSLEPLGARVEDVERLTGEVQSDLADTETRVTELGQQAQAVQEQVDGLDQRSERFQEFFDGLQELLDQLFEPAAAQ